MPDVTAPSCAVQSRMRSQARRDTKAELALRRELHRRGLRYRVDCAVISGSRRRADVVFMRARVAVFVDGCFWHCCPVHGTSPKANADWWSAKLAANVRRDRDTDARLREEGWTVVRVWEHEDMAVAAEAIGARVKSGATRDASAALVLSTAGG
ncbi:MAG TPA: very short patch repair endonuclease [Mycobacteriales bacterium]|nr:very short patch repair endonuclease [Mycobacteriales bacterium]